LRDVLEDTSEQPHTLRRTFASILAVCDVPPRRAMSDGPHRSDVTLAIYQQVLDTGAGSIKALETLLGGSLAEARDIYNGTAAVGVSRGHRKDLRRHWKA
jgi:hypothetical protein